MSELKRGLYEDPDERPESDEQSESTEQTHSDSGEAHSQLDSNVIAVNKNVQQQTVSPRFRRHRGPFRRRAGKKRRRLTLAVLPTLLTLGNGTCGLGAIAVATSATLNWPDEQKLFVAGVLIFVGMLFDALDGSAARMTGQSSQFGAELDSLCDAISFGAAPAVIVWRISDAYFFPHRVAWAIGTLFALCVLIRLARFNVETAEDDSHEGFDGLPSPAAAGTLAAFAIAMPDLAAAASETTYPEWIRNTAVGMLQASHYFIPALALALAYLMVSRFQYPHIIQQWVRGRRAPHQIGQALFALASVFLLHWLALPMAFCCFAFYAPIRSWLNWRNASDSVTNVSET